MANKNRIQQPYGYRDGGEYTSGANMLCNAISSLGDGGSSKDIANSAFFKVAYADDLESFVFSNSGGTPVGTAAMHDVKFSKLIESASYNSDTNKIEIVFENQDKIEIGVDGIVPFTAFKDGLEKDGDNVKVKVDDTSEEYITVSEGGIKISGIKDNIDKIPTIEVALETEESSRKAEDEKIWGAIGDVTASTITSLNDKIDTEIQDRKDGDNATSQAIANEVSAREAADQEIKGLIGDLTSSVTSGNTSIAELIANEKKAREDADNTINASIEAEVEDRSKAIANVTGAVNELQKSLADETTNRVNADNDLSSKIAELKEGEKLDVVAIEKVTEGLSQSVRESYKFKKADGSYLEQTIDIYKDSSLIKVELKEINNKKYMVFTYLLENGDESQIQVDVEELLIESEFQDGLSAVSLDKVVHVKVKVDGDSEKYLTVSPNGIKVSGVDKAINDKADELSALIKAVSSSTIENAENIAKKANKTDVEDSLSLKANKADTENTLGLKADKTAVNDSLSLKADKSELNTLSTKVDANASDIVKKANKADVDDLLQLKADKQTVSESLALKANSTDVDEKISEAKKLIKTEETARIDSDSALSDRVDVLEADKSNRIYSVNPLDASVSVNDDDAKNPKLGVSLSSQLKDGIQNNIRLNVDGLFSVASMSYNKERNSITFVNNDATSTFDLNGVDGMQKLTYVKPNKQLVLAYTVNGQTKEISGDMSELDNNWVASDTKAGAISLVKADNVLSGSVIINTSHEDNALKNDSGSLYVSKNDIVGDLLARIEALEAKVAQLETASTSEVKTQSAVNNKNVIDTSDYDLFVYE